MVRWKQKFLNYAWRYLHNYLWSTLRLSIGTRVSGNKWTLKWPTELLWIPKWYHILHVRLIIISIIIIITVIIIVIDIIIHILYIIVAIIGLTISSHRDCTNSWHHNGHGYFHCYNNDNTNRLHGHPSPIIIILKIWETSNTKLRVSNVNTNATFTWIQPILLNVTVAIYFPYINIFSLIVRWSRYGYSLNFQSKRWEVSLVYPLHYQFNFISGFAR